MEGGSDASATMLAELRRSRLSPAEMDDLEARFRALEESCAAAREGCKGLEKTERRQENEILGEKIKVERLKEAYEAERRDFEALDAERERIRKQLDDLGQKETVSKYEAAELERTRDELTEEVAALARENDELVRPEVRKLEDWLGSLKDQLQRVEESFQRDSARRQALVERSEALGEDKVKCTTQLSEMKELVQKVSVEPERIHKQAESVKKAADKLRSELGKVVEKKAALEAEYKRQTAKRKETEDVLASILHKLELHRETITHRQRDVDTVKKNVEVEKARTQQLLEVKAELKLRRREVEEESRHESDVLSLARKEVETLRRRYRNKRAVANSARELLPTLQAQVADHEHQLRSHVEENKRNARSIEALRQEVDLAIARLLRQEGTEKRQRADLEALLRQVANMEDEIANWNAEERRQNKLIAVLSAQREMKAREATRAQAAERATREQVKVKELVILGLSKKNNEVHNRLKEFSALYDVVKNERNKYVNLIQSSSQALAEMKEKIKILMSEVEILRNESLAKDKALAKEHSQHVASQVQRDSLRLDLYRSQAEYRKRQEVVEQQIVEIDKLNSFINNLEREMLRLKTQFERAVEARNATGVSLIDRNDELCILYEKVNLQEQTIQSGELGVRQKDEDIRMLRLQLAEVQRQVLVTRKQLPQIPTLATKVVSLKQELQQERERTEALCRELESPSNSGRWRALPGDDPDREQLLAKTAVLEERLNMKKEALLENELILEEVTNLTNKLRSRANQGRDATLDLARKVNEYQSRIRDATRKMMSVVSELSMYQATAMKLHQQKHQLATQLDQAKWRLAQNQPPTADSKKELARRIKAAAQPAPAKQHPAKTPQNLLRTTAEPRPNAYIPDASGGLGVPKPYGALAPFKPQTPGATSRHIRPPLPQVIMM